MAFGFLDQVAQGLFADDREHDLAHDPVGVIEGGPGEVEEEVLLAADALQVVEQLAVHPAFGPGADLVDGLGQEVDQVVGDWRPRRCTKAASQVSRVASGCRRSSWGASTATRRR